MKLRDLFNKNRNNPEYCSTTTDEVSKDELIEQLRAEVASLEEELHTDIKRKTIDELKKVQTLFNNATANSFTFSGGDIQISNGKVFIDGVEQLDATDCVNKNIFIKLTGKSDIDITNSTVTINGDVEDIDVTNSVLYCGNVAGDIDATGSAIYRR